MNTYVIDNEFILQDRLQKIRQIINQYGEENFYISFSGGKDSTVLSALVDMAIPDNTIPRVYANTGIEYRLIVKFVEKMKEREHSWDLVILKPSVPIKPMLEQEGYPFKSKEHSERVSAFRRNGYGNGKWIKKYLGIVENSGYLCPKILRYQFDVNIDLPFKISDKCCEKLKEEPLRKWMKENHKPYGIVGIMPSEGGRRTGALCLAFQSGKLKNFQPLVPVTKAWEDWFISEYNIELSEIYKPPYNFNRTGCKGCPFNPKLQKDLDILEQFFPEERKQCEYIWKPVYEEYRRIGYRLKENNNGKR